MGDIDRALTCEALRSLVAAACGADPGALTPGTRLDDVDRDGLGRLMLVAAIESAFAIDFPADLLTALETVDDLLYFTNVKVAHRGPVG